jgi:hypothetical protein
VTADTDDRPGVDVTNTAEAADWLRGNLGTGRLAGMFNRTGEIVFTPRQGEDGYIEPADGDDDGPAQVRPVDPSRIASTIQWTYAPYRVTVNARTGIPIVKPAMFPRSASQVAVDRPDMVPGLRVLRGVTHTPVVRSDGTILSARGYDPATRLLHLPEPGLEVPPVPEQPTLEEVAAAVAVLEHMFGEFPFVTIHHRANYYALLLTPVLRQLVPPPYKMFALTAPQPGSGKTLLATAARIVHGGVFRGSMPADDAEPARASPRSSTRPPGRSSTSTTSPAC